MFEVINEAMPREVSVAETESIQQLLHHDEKLRNVAHVFSVEWNECQSGSLNYGIFNWMPRVHHHWLAVTDRYLRVGEFVRLPVDFGQYRKNRGIKTWHSILNHRSFFLALPTVCTSEIVGHSSLDPMHLSQVSIDRGGTDAYVFDSPNFWEWRWVLDANGMQSAGASNLDGSWSSSTSPLYLNRLQYVTAGNQVELYSFHESICEIADGIVNLLGSNLPILKEKKSKTKKAGSQRDSTDKIDVDGLAKLAALHKSGALTDEEFAKAKANLLA